jgi:hypothetical protein
VQTGEILKGGSLSTLGYSRTHLSAQAHSTELLQVLSGWGWESAMAMNRMASIATIFAA